MDRVIPVLVLLIVLGVIAVIVVRLFRNAKRDEDARSWPTTEATIQSGGMETVGGGRSAVTLPCFAFSYIVNGEYYAGRFSLSGDEDRSASLIREMINRKIYVKYDPANPESHLIAERMIEGCSVGGTND